MKSTRTLFEMAKLSQAAYINFGTSNLSESRQVVALAGTQKLLPNRLATDLFVSGPDPWHVAAPPQGNDEAGFAATLFENGGGDLLLAVRGTDSRSGEQRFRDLVADFGDIGGLGLALGQAVSLFNYIERLSAEDSDRAVLQLALRSSSTAPVGVASVAVRGPDDGSRGFRESARER